MRQSEVNYLSMAAVTLQTLDANKAYWNSNIPFTGLVNFLREDLAALNTAQMSGGDVSTGATIDKEKAGDAAIAQAAKLSKLAQVYLLDIDNNTLRTQIKMSTAQMDRFSDEELSPMLQKFHDKLFELGASVTAYGVNSSQLELLQNLINQFTAIKSSPRLIIVERKGHNINIASLMRHLRANFYKTDRLINIWNDNLQFMNDYQNARIILNLGTRHKPVVAAPVIPPPVL